jgi:hypothetical protein
MDLAKIKPMMKLVERHIDHRHNGYGHVQCRAR